MKNKADYEQSKKYGVRALKRYPIFWGLSNIGALPNPDPADMDEWDGELPDPKSVVLDEEAEAARGQLRLQAQEWAGLKADPNAQLFVFVGRWSEQKGVDLVSVLPGQEFTRPLLTHPKDCRCFSCAA